MSETEGTVADEKAKAGVVEDRHGMRDDNGGLGPDLAVVAVIAHAALLLLGSFAAGVALSTMTIKGTAGLLMVLSSTFYPILLPGFLVAVVPPAMLLTVAYGAPRKLALAACVIYLMPAVALLGLGVSFVSAPALAAAVALGILSALSAKVGFGR